MVDKDKVLKIEVTHYDKIELLRNGIEEYLYLTNFGVGEKRAEEDLQKLRSVEVTHYDKVILLRNEVEEYSLTVYPRVGEESLQRNPSCPGDGKEHLSRNFYYLEDAGYIDWWGD